MVKNSKAKNKKLMRLLIKGLMTEKAGEEAAKAAAEKAAEAEGTEFYFI